jgi:uncharacterized protein (DUF1501 family)
MNTRRHFLRRSAAFAAAALGSASLAPLVLRQARAADYRALVCVFQYGGNDGMNTIVPRDTSRRTQYAAVRGALALPNNALVPLAGSDYGLHPSLAALQPVWDAGQLAPVFNIGPLNRPLSKAQLLAEPPGSLAVPQGLFSHADQQIQWEAGQSVSLAATGWGGRAAQTLATANPVISVGGNGHFGIESLRAPLVLPGPGEYFGAYGLSPAETQWTPNRLRKEAVDALFAQPQGSALADAFRLQQMEAFALSERLAEIVIAMPGDPLTSAAIDAAFAPLIVGGVVQGQLGPQLFQIAKLLAHRAVVGGERQLFFATQGGYDTHNAQIAGGNAQQGAHASLLRDLGDAMAAFQRAMQSLCLADQVVLFTQSDFGRTFAPNATAGTDHAWGNHHLVMGGAVRGGETHGRYPTLELGGPDDVGVEEWELQGRWIPGASVDQYAATLLRWFGAEEGQLDSVLPNLANFGSARSLGFL